MTCKRQDFKFHPYCKNLELTHLMFADDLILFSKADPTTLNYLKEALEKFHMSAGLRINAHKSQIIFGGCPEELQENGSKLQAFKWECSTEIPWSSNYSEQIIQD